MLNSYYLVRVVTPEASKATPAIGDSRVEVGAHHYGLRDSLATDIAEACCDMGYSGPTYQVGPFFGRADDLHTAGCIYGR